MASSESADADVLSRLTALVGHTDAAAPIAAADLRPLIAAADAHGVLLLLAERLLAEPRLPPDIHRALSDAACLGAVDDLVQRAELVALLNALAEDGVDAIVFKGAQLADSYYPRSDLRPRVDTDLLLAPGTEARAGAVLERLGYVRRDQTPGDLVSYQAAYGLERDEVTRHLVDVHWRIANPQAFGGLLSFDEAAARAVPVPSLGRVARGLCPAHALLIACVHPAAHHLNEHVLLWQYDIDLITSRFSPVDWTTFLDAARVAGVTTVCRAALARAHRDFGTSTPRAIAQALAAASPAEEPTGAYLSPGGRHAGRVWRDLRALPTWRDQSHLVRQHLFPPAAYMRKVYAPSSGAPLTWLYARRVVAGAQKWLARS